MADADDKPPAPDPNDSVDYWKGEAKKAFEARDKIKTDLTALKSNVLSKEDRELFDRLKSEHEQIEEKRKRAEGQFDTLKTELVTKHQQEADELKRLLAERDHYIENGEIDRAFYGATDYFGGDSAKTVLTPDIAAAAFRKYVAVENVDLGDGVTTKRVVVKDTKGQVIHGKDGNPAPFAEALGELLQQLPNKTRILRGSGKTGSGSSGGSHDSLKELDLDAVIAKARSGDKEAVKALKARTSAQGGLVMGTAFNR
jgi:predicted RNA-binding protein with EMAP domain